MSDNRGIFTLDELYELQVSGLFEHINDVWIYARNIKNDFGFYAGYHDGGHSYVTNIYRHDFSDDTITSASQLTVAKSQAGAVSSSDYGYFFGGRNPSASVVSNVDRLDFNNNTTATSPKGNLANPINICDSAGNASYGYVHGESSGSYASNIYRINYANDTATAPAHLNFPAAKYYGAAMGNQSYGYWAGGSTPAPSYTKTSTIHRVDYSNDTADASPKGTLNNIGVYGNNTQTSGQGNADYGYVAGGYIFAAVTNVRRIDYSNDTAVTVDKGDLASQFAKGASTGNHSNGYFAGGSNVSSIQKVDFSNDTATATAVASLTGAGNSPFFIGDSGTGPLENGNPITYLGAIEGIPATTLGPAYGYISGGGGPPYKSKVDRIDFSNDTATASTKGPLSASRAYMHNMSSPAYGYNAGGNYNGGAPLYSLVDRIDFSNDTATAAAKGSLSVVHFWGGGASNNSYGYAAGGATTTPADSNEQSTVDRVDFASDTDTAVTKGPLSLARLDIHGAGNQSYAYFGGGYTGWPNLVSTMDRIDYSNDTATAAVKGPLSITRGSAQGSGNADYGYFMGGVSYNPTNFRSNVDRVDYSNDTPTTSPKGNLSLGRRRAGGTGDQSYGYCAGGAEPGTSVVDRIDFANDTATAAVKGPLTATIYAVAGTGARMNANGTTGKPARKRFSDGATEVTAGPAFGYFGGGREEGGPSPGNKSTVDRIDYSNDTATATPKGPLTANKYALSATGNTSHGYYGGGRDYESKMDRIDYSNDTATASAKGQLSVGRYRHAAVGNGSFGYFAGGQTSPIFSSVDRVDYGNDTATTSPKGTLSFARSNLAGGGTGNTSFGYIGAGGPGNRSSVDRIDYSNDTATAAVKGPLSRSNEKLAATGNADFGYFAGGGPFPAEKTTIDRIDYANDTATAVEKGPLAAAMYWSAGTGNSSFGYFGGGGYPAISTVQRIEYANDTATAVTKGSLNNFKYGHGATSAQSKGFPNAPIAAPYQPPFSTPEQLYNPATNKLHGYWACGQNRNPAPTTLGFSSVDRLDFSNDTTAASPKGNASFAYANLQSVANASYGYITGGYTDHPPSGRQSSINRLDFANDTAALTVTGSTPSDVNPEGIYLGWGVGNASYGYWGGNYPGKSNIFRLDYSNDTSAPIITGKSINFSYGAAAGNQDYGWIGGVGHPLPSGGSRVERLDYSNDSNNTVTKGPLSSVRYDGAASSNASYGWWGGGKNGSPAYSYVDRITFASDTSTATPKGNLDYATSNNQGTGDTNYGYFGGGGPAFSARSYIQRIDYANDTATTSPKGPLSVPRDGSTAFSAAANAMP